MSEIGDDDSVFPFNYQRSGRQALPFFSSAERAQHFASVAVLPPALRSSSHTVYWLDLFPLLRTTCSSSFLTHAPRRSAH